MTSVIVRFINIFLVLISTSIFAQRKATTPALKKISEDYKMLAYGATTNTNSGLLGGLVIRHSSAVGSMNGHSLHRYIAIEAINIKNPKKLLIEGDVQTSGSTGPPCTTCSTHGPSEAATQAQTGSDSVSVHSPILRLTA